MGLKRKVEDAGVKAANHAVESGEIAEHEAGAFREGFEKGYHAGRLDKPDVRTPVYLPPDGEINGT